MFSRVKDLAYESKLLFAPGQSSIAMHEVKATTDPEDLVALKQKFTPCPHPQVSQRTMCLIVSKGYGGRAGSFLRTSQG